MPHNLFLHSSLVISRKFDDKAQANMYYNIESTITLFISFLINTSVIATFAEYTYDYKGAKELDLESASQALSQTYEESAKYIWCIGLLAAG